MYNNCKCIFFVEGVAKMKKSFFKNIYILLLIILMCLPTGCSLINKNRDTKNSQTKKFYVGGTTTKKTTIETEHFVITVPKNVYIPGYIKDYIEVVYDSVEAASGLSFNNATYNIDKINLNVKKIATNDGEKDYSGSPIVNSSEDSITIGSSDLLLGNGYYLIEGMIKLLKSSQTLYTYDTFLQGGYFTYLTYKTLKYLEINFPNVASANGHYSSLLSNNQIFEDSQNNKTIYDYSVEHWMNDDNLIDATNLSSNGGFSIGMRFMYYLDSVYGDASKWFKDYENANGSCGSQSKPCALSVQTQIQLVKTAYGDNVLNNFYDWLKSNGNGYFDGFDCEQNKPFMDTTKVDTMYFYPYIYTNNRMQSYESIEIELLKYNNLIINIDEIRNYLGNYLGKDVSKLTIRTSKPIRIELYNSKDQVLKKIDRVISLSGVSYVKLYGEGTLGRIYDDGTSITGFKIVYKQSDIDKEEPLEEDIVEDGEEKEEVQIGGQTSNFKVGQIISSGTHSYKYFNIKYNSNTYVPGYLAEYMEVLFETMEQVMGTDYDDSPHSSNSGIGDNIISMVINNGDSCFVSSDYRTGYVCDKDLLLGNTSNLLRVLIEIFGFVETRWQHNDLYEAGINVYTMYKIIKYLEANNIDVAKAVSNYSSKNLLADYIIYDEDYDALFSKDMEYWIRNTSETWNAVSNGYFSIGLRFMMYLDEVYANIGGYMAWLRNYESQYPYTDNSQERIEANIDNQIIIMKNTYGINVFNNFYEWLRNNKSLFDYSLTRDYTQITHAYIYPLLDEDSIKVSKVYFKYNNIYISINEIRNYLRNYKGVNVDKLKLKLSDDAKVELYDSSGILISEGTNSEFSLANVCYIKLVGEGIIDSIQITY